MFKQFSKLKLIPEGMKNSSNINFWFPTSLTDIILILGINNPNNKYQESNSILILFWYHSDFISFLYYWTKHYQVFFHRWFILLSPHSSHWFSLAMSIFTTGHKGLFGMEKLSGCLIHHRCREKDKCNIF